MTGDDAARMGLAVMNLYVDGDDNERLDLAPPGTATWPDRVLGTSAQYGDRLVADFVIYREGEVSSLWKLISGIYGCAEVPPVGFSTMHVVFERDDFDITNVSCTVVDGPVDVFVEDSDRMSGRVCAPVPALDEFNRPGPADGLPAGAAFQCQDNFSMIFASDPDSLCPDLQRFDLIGCTDRTSQATCAATFFDDTFNPPAWWPCVSLNVSGAAIDELATDELDTLATFTVTQGVLVDLSSLEAEAEIGGAVFALDIEAFDNDDNGLINTGDTIVVREQVEVFNPDTPLGRYRVRLRNSGGELAQTFYAPVAIGSGPVPFEIEIVDATPAETNLDGTSFFVDAISGPERIDPSDLIVHVAWSCEPSFPVSGDDLTLIDRDGDGLFGAGDRLAVAADPEEDFFNVPTGFDCISLVIEPGENVVRHIGNGTWTIETNFVPTLAGAFTDELDIIAEIDVVIEWSDEIYIRVSTARNNRFVASEGVLFQIIDDGDGIASPGDRLILTEEVEILGADASGLTLNFSFYVGGLNFYLDPIEVP